ARSQSEFAVRYSGLKVVAVSPACSGDRQRVLTWVGVALPFMVTVSVTCHRPGAMPSAKAGAARTAPSKATARMSAETFNRHAFIMGRTYRARWPKASGARLAACFNMLPHATSALGGQPCPV